MTFFETISFNIIFHTFVYVNLTNILGMTRLSTIFIFRYLVFDLKHFIGIICLILSAIIFSYNFNNVPYYVNCIFATIFMICDVYFLYTVLRRINSLDR